MKEFVRAYSGTYNQNLWNTFFKNESSKKIFLVTFALTNTDATDTITCSIRQVDDAGRVVYACFLDGQIKPRDGWDGSSKMLLYPGDKIEFMANDIKNAINIYMVGIKGVN